MEFNEEEIKSCCGSTKFAKSISSLSPFSNFDHLLKSARNIWFDQVDVSGWLQAFSAHPQIGQSRADHVHATHTSVQWSKGEQSTAMATANSTILQELSEWNALYKEKFGFVFLICASGRSSEEILAELKKRYSNRPIVELEIAAQEQMKITELRLAKLVSAKYGAAVAAEEQPTTIMEKAGEDRLSMIGAHLATTSDLQVQKTPSKRSRPPITTHVLDTALGRPSAGIEVLLETWRGPHLGPSFMGPDPSGCWTLVGSGKTDEDGRSNPLMSIIDAVNPGIYRISFNTGKYNPSGFFPFVSIVFQITESQKFEHFHVPLLLSPFGFSTYRGS